MDAPRSERPDADDRRSSYASLAILVGFVLLYALLPSRNTNYADDSLDWAEQLTRTAGLVNSHHLALNIWRVVWHGLTDGLGLAIAPQRLLALWSAICGALGLLALWHLLRRTHPGPLALAAVLACGFSSGYWSYAIVGDVYVPAIAFLLIGTERFLAALHAPDTRRATQAALAAIAALFVSVLHHQAHAVYVAVLAPATLLLGGIRWSRRLAVAGAVPLLVGVLSLATYAGVYSTRPKAPDSSFGGFLAGYAGHFDARADQKVVGVRAAVNALGGEARALLSYNVLFRSKAATRAIQARFPYRNVYPYPYLVRNLPLPLASGIWFAAVLAGLLAFALVSMGIVRAIGARDSALLLLVSALPQAAFFMWWEGISDEFWLWTIPTLMVLAATGARALGRYATAAMASLAALLFVSTLLGSVLLFADPTNDIDTVNDAYLKRVQGQDVLVTWDGIQSTARAHLLMRHTPFQYFNIQAEAAHWDMADSTEMERLISGTLREGGHIWLGPYLRDMPASNMRFILDQNPAFRGTYPRLIARLEQLDSTRTTWLQPVARDPDLFERY
ncbi:MAG: hypothetical protein ABIU54_05005 [Candidatus Eisenbacteria bacterium]